MFEGVHDSLLVEYIVSSCSQCILATVLRRHRSRLFSTERLPIVSKHLCCRRSCLASKQFRRKRLSPKFGDASNMDTKRMAGPLPGQPHWPTQSSSYARRACAASRSNQATVCRAGCWRHQSSGPLRARCGILAKMTRSTAANIALIVSNGFLSSAVLLAWSYSPPDLLRLSGTGSR